MHGRARADGPHRVRRQARVRRHVHSGSSRPVQRSRSGSPQPGDGLPKVGVVRDVGLAKPHPAVDAALSAAAERLEHAGYVVEEIELPLLGEAARLWSLLVIGDIGLMMPTVEEFGDDSVRESLASQLAIRSEIWGDGLDFAAYGNGMARRGTLITQLQQLLGSDRLLLTPVSAEPPFEQDADLTGPNRTRELIAAQWPMTAVPVLGFPAVAVPTGVHEGLPTGVQLIGGRFEENLLFDAAAVIETVTGRLTPIDPMGSVSVSHG
ncbi:amidase family protein [Amycolatopsis sp.]|uniref:amidase family protein n=1 Tax=Amycolatopsis sp. TaxID=37632 RepID=UPI00262C622D|nr:amidase family protein [Amycolatopsis sp.]